MNPVARFAGLLLLVALVATGACMMTRHYAPSFRKESQEDREGHEWMHAQLRLTADQEKRLEPIEARFAEKRRHFAELVRLANVELSQAILEDQQDSPRVQASVGKIHEALGGLQKATLDHVFEMKEVLTPEQYRKLLDLTAESLRSQP
ncbi:MAG TPA: periplasmic heavy metal sensor [Candidatus Methylacidiphilales bacterium]